MNNTPQSPVSLLDGRITATYIEPHEIRNSIINADYLNGIVGAWRLSDNEQTERGTLAADFPLTEEMASELDPSFYVRLAIEVFNGARENAGLPDGNYPEP